MEADLKGGGPDQVSRQIDAYASTGYFGADPNIPISVECVRISASTEIDLSQHYAIKLLVIHHHCNVGPSYTVQGRNKLSQMADHAVSS